MANSPSSAKEGNGSLSSRGIGVIGLGLASEYGPEATEIEGDDVGRHQETRSGRIVMQDGEKKRRTPSESRRTEAAEAERRARLLKRKTRRLVCDAPF
jgi:hypothetical protein